MMLYFDCDMRFTSEQLKALAGIAADAGQVFLATAVVPFIFGVDRIPSVVLVSGLALTLACWAASIILAKGKTRRTK